MVYSVQRDKSEEVAPQERILHVLKKVILD